MEKTKKARDVRLDIIRIFSLFCVIAVHFFLNSGFYNEIVIGKKMYIMSIIRSFFIICVPMFIMLTGYLVNGKTLSKKYYKGIIKILIIYLICSIIYSLFVKFYLKEEMTFTIFLKKLISYSGTRYSWYIEMYIGLFLLIPFFNIIINSLKSKKEYQLILITLIILIALPSILNIFKFDSIDWWKKPSISKSYVKILPAWWTSGYPVLYYFLGAYLKRYTVNINTKLNIFLLVIFTIIDGTFNFYRSFSVKYIWGSWNSYSSLFVMIETFLVFNLLLKINLNNNSIRNNLLKTLSNACLGAYLISCMYDKIIYDKLEVLIPNVKQRFIYAPVVVLLSFTCSIITSILINTVYKYGFKLINSIKGILDLKTEHKMYG